MKPVSLLHHDAPLLETLKLTTAVTSHLENQKNGHKTQFFTASATPLQALVLWKAPFF